MGRVKKYSKQHSNRHRSQSAKKNRENNEAKDSDSDNSQKMNVEMSEGQKAALSVAKRKQIFKKSKDGRRDVKKKI